MPVAESDMSQVPVDLIKVFQAIYPDLAKSFGNSNTISPAISQLPISVNTEQRYARIQDVSPKSDDLKSPEQPSSSNSSSPRGSADRSDSPASTVSSLPKESDHSERKRPFAIQELLQSKKARLQHQKVKLEEELSARQSPAPSASEGRYGPLGDVFERINRGDDDDSETTSSGGSVTGSTPAIPKFAPNLSTESAVLLMALQNQQLSENRGFSLTPQHRIPSAANDSGVIEDPNNSGVPLDRPFAQVPGRLSLLSNVVKYKMSVGEVRRRLMGPEAFNFSLLGALLRRAKMPEKSQLLVKELGEVGISIARGRRRMSSVTLLSALTESESVQLAHDFQQLTDKEFPVKQLSDKSIKDHFTHKMKEYSKAEAQALAKDRLKNLEKTRDVASEFINLLNMDRSPVCESNPTPILESNIQDPLSTFSMLTHGFGTPAVLVGMKTFYNFLNNQIDSLSIATRGE